jgi:hypothetical protein
MTTLFPTAIEPVVKRYSRNQNRAAEANMRNSAVGNTVTNRSCSGAGDTSGLLNIVSGANIFISSCSHKDHHNITGEDSQELSTHGML